MLNKKFEQQIENLKQSMDSFQPRVEYNNLLQVSFIYSFLLILSMFFIDFIFIATDLDTWQSDYEKLQSSEGKKLGLEFWKSSCCYEYTTEIF